MPIKVAINGFGRIGRLVLRALLESGRRDLEVVAINDLSPADTHAHLLAYDSVHGFFNKPLSVDGNDLIVDGRRITVFSQKDPLQLPWGDLGIDIVMECSGHFTSRDKAQLHLQAGAKKVLISAPANDADLTVVYGVNHEKIMPNHRIISNASCTTNCLAPLVHVLQETCGVRHGHATTVHSYTGDQVLVDGLHKDLRRARAAALSMIPTSTGAAKAVGLVIPELAGKLDGTAIRVPTPNVSLVDFNFVSQRPTSEEAIHEAMWAASQGGLKGILGFNDKPLVSIDFNHNAHSSIFDATQTKVLEGTFGRVMAWYDNEWGFSNRMADVAVCMHNEGV